MINEVDYGPLNIEIRAHETELLDNAFYQQLLTANSMDAAIKMLQGTPYEFLRKNEDKEEGLSHYLEQEYAKAFQLSPNSKVIEFAALEYVYHNLKVLFKSYYTEKDLRHLLINIGPYDLEDLGKAVRSGTSDVIEGDYLTTIHKVREYMNEYENVHHLDALLDYYYFEHWMELAKEIHDPELIQSVKEYVDLHQMTVAMRLAKMGKPISAISGLVPDVGAIPTSDFVQWAKEGPEGLSRALMETPYRELLTKLTDDKQWIDPTKLEKLMDDRRMVYQTAAKYEAFGPKPILAFLYAKETEIKNIRVILNGIANGLPKEIVEKTLRQNYK